jgi:CheY-like chemotaxis protein
MHRQTSRLPDQRARKEDDMMGGKQGSVSGVGAEGSDQELPSAGGWQLPSIAADTMTEGARVRAGGTPSQQGPRVLLIADDPDLGDWLLEEFQHVGCAVALATRGQDGLELLRSGLVDVVISEMGLPDLPGMDLLRELQTLAKIPKVILTTSRDSDSLASRAIQNGASAVLRKPFRMEQLLTSIARALGN